ncbi:transcription initiation factor TFIID subunit 11-like [Agrilus planipennis]|uniref:Transcription initiation factor TFIID subunit 11-like n=1 Tax=Agrilus planipennis TaxID=224129 RepID=A0A7F5REI3_AGRPL|nr:transcription initiation factor TFIID subunit 11-like [Agrilus planipennis]
MHYPFPKITLPLTACQYFFFVSVCPCRVEKANAQVITRSRTGNLPPARPTIDSAHEPPSKITVTTKATPEEIKEKMEQQLRMQRAAHQQKRALELKNLPTGQVIKVVGSPAQAASATTSTSTTTTTSVTTTNTTTSTKSATSNPTPIQPKGRWYG